MAVSEETFSVIKKITWTWISDASGDYSAATTAYFTGVVSRVVQKPNSGGTQPSALYDVVVNDDDSIDVLRGNGANLANGSNTDTNGLNTPIANSQLTCVVSNAGNAKGGTVILYITGV